MVCSGGWGLRRRRACGWAGYPAPEEGETGRGLSRAFREAEAARGDDVGRGVRWGDAGPGDLSTAGRTPTLSIPEDTRG